MKSNNTETEQAILDAAKQVFITKGYAGAQMQKIADLAGVNKALIHYYFRSKQKLFDHVLQNILKTIMKPLFVILQKPLSVADKLKDFINSYTDTLNDNPHIPLFMLHQLSTNKTMIVKFYNAEIKSKLEKFINEIITNSTATPETAATDPRQLFVSFISMLAFPFVAKDIFSALFNLSPEQYRKFTDERKNLLYQIVENNIHTSD